MEFWIFFIFKAVSIIVEIIVMKGKVCQVAHQAKAYPSFCSINYEYFYSPLDGMLVHYRVTHSMKFTGTHLYTWVERGTVRVTCLA